MDKMIARNYFGLNEDEKVLLFFGFIRPYKGLDLLIEGLAKTKSKNVKLIIAGEFYTDENLISIWQNNGRLRIN